MPRARSTLFDPVSGSWLGYQVAGSRDRGLTLLEVLVVLSILGVLIGITVPAIRQARAAAAVTASLSNLRENVGSLHRWAAAHDDKVPRAPEFNEGFSGEPVPLYMFRSPPADGFIHDWGSPGFMTDYFGQERTWHLTLYITGEEPTEAWWKPGVPREDWRIAFQARPFISSYLLSLAYLAGPEHWVPGAESDQSATMWRDVRLTETDHPSRKALLHDAVFISSGRDDADPPSGTAQVGFADGHVGTRDLSESRSAVKNRWRSMVAQPLAGTERGVRGRDF